MDTKKGILNKSLSLTLIILSLVFCVSCGRLGNAKAELIGQDKTIVYNGVRYAPLDGLSCWMWSGEGMEYVGKYESRALFNNSVSNVYAPVSNDADPRLYAEAYASGYIRWLKQPGRKNGKRRGSPTSVSPRRTARFLSLPRRSALRRRRLLRSFSRQSARR